MQHPYYAPRRISSSDSTVFIIYFLPLNPTYSFSDPNLIPQHTKITCVYLLSLKTFNKSFTQKKSLTSPYKYHKFFSVFLLLSFLTILFFFIFDWGTHHTYKNYYFSHESQQFVGELTSVKRYPFQKPQTLLNQIVFEYLRGPVDPFLRNPVSEKGTILFALLIEEQIIVNFPAKILEKINDEKQEELLLGGVILSLQSSSILQKKVKTISFVFSGEIVNFIKGGINLYRPIPFHSWRPKIIPVALTTSIGPE